MAINYAQLIGGPTSGLLDGFRNRIINGDMRIDQRGTAATPVVPSASATYSVDRWFGYEDTDGGCTLGQSAVAPTGFTNSLLYTVTSADGSLSAAQYSLVGQRVEGANGADFAWGTANAKAITLSFWVRSSLTGTFGGSIINGPGTRSYVYTYTVSAANTWEYKTVTIPGDTSGSWGTGTSDISIQVYFSMGAGTSRQGTAGAWAAANLVTAPGAVSVIGTNGATFYVTGVQVEIGSVASDFQRRDYGTELGLCQRYYQRFTNLEYLFYSAAQTTYLTPLTFTNAMRATPTANIISNGTIQTGGTPVTQGLTTQKLSLGHATSNTTAARWGFQGLELEATSEL